MNYSFLHAFLPSMHIYLALTVRSFISDSFILSFKTVGTGKLIIFLIQSKLVTETQNFPIETSMPFKCDTINKKYDVR